MADRLDALRSRLKARTDARGQPLPGYAENVATIRKEIERLEARS